MNYVQMTNSPAFPDGLGKKGMTLRDYFAAQAMQGMIVDVVQPQYDYIAETAYSIADAMMKAREA
jgi:hypothetical protein